MPMMQALVGELNARFTKDRIHDLVRRIEMFAPGQRLNPDLVAEPGTVLHRALRSFFHRMPDTFHESLHAIIRTALSTSPPTEVTFAWAPGYDYELTLWQAPDTQLTRGGITVLLKSRYPDDKHPLQADSAD
ncbi:MAG: hypothetical protein JSR86_18230 [Proteobacteria bacterium]|nr:hypothetical protein [Pseudomonadota bacterium]